jgi:type VI secretion system protein ImpA
MPTVMQPQPSTRLAPLDDDFDPSGRALEYDPVFVAMERAARGREEQQFGDTVIDAEPPQWAAVCKLATDLLERTHDLRVGVHLAEAVIDSEGLAGFAECLEMLAVWLKREWDTVHPQLDGDDEFDPTLRVNILTRLTDSRRVLERLCNVTVADVRGLGTVHVGDLIAIAEKGTEDNERLSALETTLAGCPQVPLVAAATSLRTALAAVKRLDQALCERIGVAKSVEFGPLTRILKLSLQVLADRLERRQICLETAPQPGSTSAVAQPAMSGLQDAAATLGSTNAGLLSLVEPSSTEHATECQPGTARISPRDWQIASRDDVTSALDRLCAYFAQYEPSSPIPLLLARAKRLVPMTFLEILQELGPDVLSQAQRLQGDAR